MRLLAATQMLRAQVTQELRCVLEKVGEDKGLRRVQVLVPASPAILGAVSPDPAIDPKNTGDLGKAMGFNRTYKATPLLPGAAIIFHLLPEQELWLASESGTATVGLVVEYWGETPNV